MEIYGNYIDKLNHIISFLINYLLWYIYIYIYTCISILPGLVSAPFGFIAGVHTSFYHIVDQQDKESEAVKIFLDENRIDFGASGPPPPLPEKKARKLYQAILSAGHIFELRGDTWRDAKCPFYDDAFAAKPNSLSQTIAKSDKIDQALRAAFLKFFVSLLKNYRKHLIYGSIRKFDTEAFLAEQAVESRPFLEQMLESQLFSQFVDSRVFEIGRDPDVVFFDESIDAKQNRYTLQLLRGNIDTPFLNSLDSKHHKTYVAPSPDITNYPHDGPFLYPNGLGQLK